ncbi:hypothetical protein DRN52_05515 [Thermococci archaeon]|nr:MAG: hypothetical protein DRN52_05515 [Thermococci archaeon]
MKGLVTKVRARDLDLSKTSLISSAVSRRFLSINYARGKLFTLLCLERSFLKASLNRRVYQRA